jgi:hypothetical protein
MKNTNLKKRKKHFRAIVGTSLATASLFQLAMPVLAQVAAGTGISNTATATYEAPDGTQINATSNTVIVRVAEIAGITNVPIGVEDINGGSYLTGDLLNFKFQVTNTGNDTTKIHIPTAADLAASPALLQGVSASDIDIKVYSDAALTTEITLDGQNDTPAVAAGNSVFVVVKVKVTASSAGAPISVTLGNTGANDNSAATQNQPKDITGGNNQVYTVDGTEAAPNNGAPVNGEREASAKQTVSLGTQSKPLALAVIKKTATTAPGASTVGNDDIITYSLSLEVKNTSPDPSFVPADLEATDIKLENASATKILVSDVIPTGTVYDSSGETATITVGGITWTRVYSTDDPATTISVTATGGLPAANWTATKPADNLIKRVGFIADGPILKGTTVTGLTFKVITSGLSAIGGDVYNIAQVFGQSVGDLTDEIVYDESGDNNPNNFNDNNTPPDNTGTNFDPTLDNGVADFNNQGVDTNGNNTGTGPNGEDNKVTITGTVVTTGGILTGPVGSPAAIGPNGNNDDFTNVSVTVPANTQLGTAFNPATKVISNTILSPNTTSSPNDRLDNVSIEPLAPSVASGTNAGNGNYYGNNGDIPTNTVVTIFARTAGPDGIYGNGDDTYVSAKYTYTGSVWTLDESRSGLPANAADDGDVTNNGINTDAAPRPVRIGTLNETQTADYKVLVDLPGTVTPVQAYSIPLIAYVENNVTAGVGDRFTPGSDTVRNLTINRVYTGFMSLVKEAQILTATGTVKQAWSNGTLATKAEPGEFIEYRIRYENISTPLVGTGNVGLTASNFAITEDGNDTLDGLTDNNWATTTNHRQNTSATAGTINYYNVAADLGTSDQADGSVVTKYVNSVGAVAPGGVGTFQFRRQVNP